MVFGGVFEHVGEHAGDMVVGGLIEDLLVAAGAAHQPRGAKQAQVMADQGLAGADARGDVTHCDRPVQTGEDNLEARRIAQKSIGFGNDGQVMVVG